MDKKKNINELLKADRLPLDFFLQDTKIVAMKLLGKIIVKKESDGTILAGEIVETEAYLHKNDEASHSFKGVTKRNEPMFSQGGILYVYKSYGIHHCINIVTEEENIGAAVLIRAVEPIAGIEVMKRNRGVDDIKRLCKGPGNVAKAFGFTKKDNFTSLFSDELFLVNGYEYTKSDIIFTKRVGISRSKDLFLRFYVKNSNFISRK